MKKVLLVVGCLAIATSAFALDFAVGPAVGGNFGLGSNGDWDDLIDGAGGRSMDNSLRLGFEAGVFAEVGIFSFLSIQPEVNYIMWRAGASKSDWDLYVTHNVVEIPILVKYNINAGPGKFSIFAGPLFAFTLGDVKVRLEDDGDKEFEDKEDPDSRFNFGVIAGLGYTFPAGPGNLSIDARYRRLITKSNIDAAAYEDYDYYLNNFALRVGYGFRF